MVGITIVGWEGIPHNSMCSANMRLPSMRGAAVVLAGRLIHLVLEDGEFRRFLGAHRQGGLQFATQLRGMDGGLGRESFSRSGRQLVRSALEFSVYGRYRRRRRCGCRRRLVFSTSSLNGDPLGGSEGFENPLFLSMSIL